MYRHIDEFLQDWNNERQKTLAILSSMTDASLGQRVSAEGRDVAFLSWHIVLAINDFMRRLGVDVDGPLDGSPAPETAAEIHDAYAAASTSLATHVRTGWTDATLQEERELYGAQWTNAVTLAVIIRHEIHHRAQLTVLLRQAGVRVPGVYGPAREEWAGMGMEAKP